MVLMGIFADHISWSLSGLGVNYANNTRANMDATDVWNSNGSLSLVLAASKHRSWFYGLKITK